MTIEQISEFYSRAILARLNYISDVRMGVWADSKDLERYYKDIAGR